MNGPSEYSKICSSEEGEDGATSPLLLASSPDSKKEADWSEGSEESDTGHH